MPLVPRPSDMMRDRFPPETPPMPSSAIGGLAALLYLTTGAWLGVRLARTGQPQQPGKGGALMLGLAAIALHALVLGQTVLRPEGLDLGFFNALSFTGWLIALLLLAATLARPVENLGIVLLPYAALTVVLALAFPGGRLVADARQWPLEAHILLSVLAYSLLALAAVQALLLAVQDHRLRHRHPGGFVRGIPPLITMERMLFQMIGAGFVALTAALASGFVFLDDVFAQHLVHKTVLSIAAWGVFGVLLWGRARFGWRGRTAIRWTLAGFAVLALAYFGSKLALELVLKREA